MFPTQAYSQELRIALPFPQIFAFDRGISSFLFSTKSKKCFFFENLVRLYPGRARNQLCRVSNFVQAALSGLPYRQV